MPIKPKNRHRYPPNWSEISLRIRRDRAGWRCECDGRCGRNDCDAPLRCLARQGHPHPVTRATVVLTVAHLDHQPEHCDDDNLLAMCQACHLNYDKEHHAAQRAARRKENSA